MAASSELLTTVSSPLPAPGADVVVDDDDDDMRTAAADDDCDEMRDDAALGDDDGGVTRARKRARAGAAGAWAVPAAAPAPTDTTGVRKRRRADAAGSGAGRPSLALLLLLTAVVLPACTTGHPAAWRSSGTTNDELVSNMERGGLVTTRAVSSALRATDRRAYVAPGREPEAYLDRPLPIGYGATISAPHMHAMVLELAADALRSSTRGFVGHGACDDRDDDDHERVEDEDVEDVVGHVASAGDVRVADEDVEDVVGHGASAGDVRVLDIGSGSGVLVAALAHLLRELGACRGRVVGIEHVGELVNRSRAAVAAANAEVLRSVLIVHGDGRGGWPAYAPYDVVHVGAAAQRSVLDALVLQLRRPGGRLVAPLADGERGRQRLVVVDVVDATGTLDEWEVTPVSYVPLTDEREQRRRGRR